MLKPISDQRNAIDAGLQCFATASPSETENVRVRLPGFTGHEPRGRGKPHKRSLRGPYQVNAFREKSDDFLGFSVASAAIIGDREVGYLYGSLIDLRSYQSPAAFVDDMDSIDQSAYDVAVAVKAQGRGYWRRRDLLLFLEAGAVAVEHRKRGLARAMAEICVRSSMSQGRELDLLLQPWPLDFAVVDPHRTDGRPIVSDNEWKAELSVTTSIWLKVFPFLRFMDFGGLDQDRAYYVGRVPRGSAAYR